MVRVDICVLGLNLEEWLLAFQCWIWCQLWVYHKWSLLFWDMYPPYPFWRELLLWKDVLFCQMLFFCIYWDDHVTFILSFVNVASHIDLHISKPPYIPRINKIWSRYMMLFIHCWFCLLIFCQGFWHLYSSKVLDYNIIIFFFGTIFVWFWYWAV